MEIFYSENKPTDLRFEWKVTRGKTNIKEDFGNAMVWAFLTGEGGLRPLSVSINDGEDGHEQNVIYGAIDASGLGVGVYGLKIIWAKDTKRSIVSDDNIYDREMSPAELLAFNKSCYSEVAELFGITPSPYADTNNSASVTFHIRSSAATYGHDGLSAYERAVLLGLYHGNETTWTRLTHIMEPGTGENAVQQHGAEASATGQNSFAVGQWTTASGNASFTEGDTTVAYGDYAHTEGGMTIAYGECAHAEGYYTEAVGDNAHAGGLASQANGDSSVAIGVGVRTMNSGEAAFGRYNDTKSNLLFSIGNGTALANKNLFEVMDNGDIYITIDGQRARLQDCLALASQTANAIVTRNIVDNTALAVTQQAEPLTGTLSLLGEVRVISTYTDEELATVRSQQAESALVLKERTRQRGYYYNAPIGNWD